ncbi:MAG: agmatine deiminase family protein [gamma proteobacterium symbiont of Bathyaustriella thionipta]|nr:agmatine deiminase family protein [gamma proteobacterium symbiont of Bathyaustriella thionipta]
MTAHLPAEWSPYASVQLTWPHAESDWGEHLAAARQCFHEIAVALLQHTPVSLLLVCSQHDSPVLRQKFAAFKQRIRIMPAATNDCWARDHAPVSVTVKGETRLVNFQFNGWGQKFDAELDNRLSASLFEQGAYPHTQLQSVTLCLEGGAIECNGQGTLLMRTSSVVDEARNPGLSQQQIQQQLSSLLGIRHFLWLRQGRLSGDDTDGHIDTLARFCDPASLVYCHTDDSSHPDFTALQAMRQELSDMRQPDGQPFRLISLPMPQPLYSAQGEMLPASYANFLICNQTVLLPIYKDAKDRQAKKVLQSCFPKHKIITINCLPLIEQHGSLHCVSMQLVKSVISGH